jgi:hypothetical protein
MPPPDHLADTSQQDETKIFEHFAGLVFPSEYADKAVNSIWIIVLEHR